MIPQKDRKIAEKGTRSITVDDPAISVHPIDPYLCTSQTEVPHAVIETYQTPSRTMKNRGTTHTRESKKKGAVFGKFPAKHRYKESNRTRRAWVVLFLFLSSISLPKVP
jgi:hypothetical protein